ncbi:porin [Burkholderia guangdongensis]|uniref:porin n=1 Tax=Burkholderia guangdongensis TaxID=1792500 RepID=UPI0015CDFE8E|nr:porin [Burkholderia guangdongensis]
MKYKIMLAAALVCANTSSYAQSSITLYGLLDEGVTYVSNEAGKRFVGLVAGENFGNRWGLRGTEDLGNGYKAIFDLESDFDLNTGSSVAGIGPALFGRQAYVGIASPYGTITLGRQYDFAWDYMTLGYFSPAAYALATGGHIGDVDRQGGDRLNNAIKYTSPSFGGVQIGALYSFGGVPGQFTKSSAYSVGAKYDGDNLHLAAIYTSVNNPAFFDPYGQLGVSTFLGQATTQNGQDAYWEGNFALDRQSSAELGASYKFGQLTVAGNVTATTFKGYDKSQTLWIYEGGLIYSFTPELQGIAAYEYEKTNDVHWNQPTVGAYYFLSKRTSLYAAASYQIASGPVVAQQGQDFYWYTPSSNHEQASMRVAIIHKF